MKGLWLLAVILVATLAARGGDGDFRLFELRTYTAKPGRLDDLHSRIRDHTAALLEKRYRVHGLGYFVPV